jgi:hypothetical protein
MIKTNNLKATKLKRSGEERFHVHFKVSPADIANIEVLQSFALMLTGSEPKLGTLMRRALDLLAETYQNRLIDALQASPQDESPAEKRMRMQSLMESEAQALTRAAGALRGRVVGEGRKVAVPA